MSFTRSIGEKVAGEIVEVHRNGSFDVNYKIGNIGYCKPQCPRDKLS